jgi:hypothetical protein
MTARFPDWEDRLSAWLEACAGVPFEYGRHDCCLFAAGAVQAMTGADFGKPFRGKYKTEAGALKALKRRGFDSIEGPFTQALGAPVAVLMAGRGDIVSNGANIGVMWAGAALFVGESGLETVPVAELQRAWSVK